MKKWQKITSGIVFSFMFCLSCVGYAAISKELVIDGNADANTQEKVFITDVKQTGGDGSFTLTNYISSVLTSDIVLPTIESTVTLTIDLHNNASSTYYYLHTLGKDVELSYSNSDIDFVISGIKEKQTTIGKKDSNSTNDDLSFTITFKYSDEYKSNNSSVSEDKTNLKSILNFVFEDTTNVRTITLTHGDNKTTHYLGDDTETTFEGVEVDNTIYAVARANNSAIPVYDSNSKTLSFSNIGFELVNTEAETYKNFSTSFNDTDSFIDDTTLNNFILLRDIIINNAENIATVEEDKNFSVDFESYDLTVDNTFLESQFIVNKGKLKLFNDSELANLSLVTGRNPISLLTNYAKSSQLTINNLLLDNRYNELLEEHDDYSAPIVVYEGQVEINSCEIFSDNTHAICKISKDAGVANRQESSDGSLIKVINSRVSAKYNDAIAIADGKGAVAITGSKIEAGYYDSSIWADTITVERHALESEEVANNQFDYLYADTLHNVNVYCTDSTLVSADSSCHYVARFASRLHYTLFNNYELFGSSANTTTTLRAKDIIEDDNISITTINGNNGGNGAADEDDYLKKDGWYFVKYYDKNNNLVNLINQNGDYVKVGESVDFFNNNMNETVPVKTETTVNGNTTVSIKNHIEDIFLHLPDGFTYDKRLNTNLYSPFKRASYHTNEYFTDKIDYQQTFLASVSEGHYNIVSMQFPDVMLLIENRYQSQFGLTEEEYLNSYNVPIKWYGSPSRLDAPATRFKLSYYVDPNFTSSATFENNTTTRFEILTYYNTKVTYYRFSDAYYYNEGGYNYYKSDESFTKAAENYNPQVLASNVHDTSGQDEFFLLSSKQHETSMERNKWFVDFNFSFTPDLVIPSSSLYTFTVDNQTLFEPITGKSINTISVYEINNVTYGFINSDYTTPYIFVIDDVGDDNNTMMTLKHNGYRLVFYVNNFSSRKFMAHAPDVKPEYNKTYTFDIYSTLTTIDDYWASIVSVDGGTYTDTPVPITYEIDGEYLYIGDNIKTLIYNDTLTYITYRQIVSTN